jgi:hypothetical protein
VGLRANFSHLQGVLNSTTSELSSAREALNLAEASSVLLRGQVASLQSEVSLLRLNLSSLTAEDVLLANSTSSCNTGLEGAISRAFGLEAGLVFVVLCFSAEILLRPIWLKYRQDPFPVDRLV